MRFYEKFYEIKVREQNFFRAGKSLSSEDENVSSARNRKDKDNIEPIFIRHFDSLFKTE